MCQGGPRGLLRCVDTLLITLNKLKRECSLRRREFKIGIQVTFHDEIHGGLPNQFSFSLPASFCRSLPPPFIPPPSLVAPLIDPYSWRAKDRILSAPFSCGYVQLRCVAVLDENKVQIDLSHSTKDSILSISPCCHLFERPAFAFARYLPHLGRGIGLGSKIQDFW